MLVAACTRGMCHGTSARRSRTGRDGEGLGRVHSHHRRGRGQITRESESRTHRGQGASSTCCMCARRVVLSQAVERRAERRRAIIRRRRRAHGLRPRAFRLPARARRERAQDGGGTPAGQHHGGKPVDARVATAATSQHRGRARARLSQSGRHGPSPRATLRGGPAHRALESSASLLLGVRAGRRGPLCRSAGPDCAGGPEQLDLAVRLWAAVAYEGRRAWCTAEVTRSAGPGRPRRRRWPGRRLNRSAGQPLGAVTLHPRADGAAATTRPSAWRGPGEPTASRSKTC